MRLIFGLSLASGLLMADQVVLKNGDRIAGRIVKSGAKTLALKPAYAGEVTIDRAQVVSFAADELLHVQLKDRTVVGQVAPAAEGAVEIKTGEGASYKAPLADVLALRTAGEQRAWEREQERVNNPRLNDFWSGFVALDFAGSAGNAKTSPIATAAAASRQAGKNRMGLYFSQVYASQSNAEPFGATANRISGYRIDRDVNNKLFVFGTTDFDYDKFMDLDLRSVLGGGLGYHIWKSGGGFRDFNASGGARIPAGARLFGELEEVKRVGFGLRRGRATIKPVFHTLLLADGETIPVEAKLIALDNAREPGEKDGRIQGIRATSVFGHGMVGITRNIFIWDPLIQTVLAGAAMATLRFPKSEIHLPAGSGLSADGGRGGIRTRRGSGIDSKNVRRRCSSGSEDGQWRLRRRRVEGEANRSRAGG